MYEEIIRQRLTECRNNAKLTQQKVANLTGIDDSLIAKIEVGIRKPDVNTVGILAKFYDVSIDWLFGMN